MSDKVKGCIGLFVFVAVLCGLFRACTSSFHNHEWQEATCTVAKTCSICGATDGDPLGHQWVNATCTAPKTCSVCGETKGDLSSHKWVKATCTEAKTCSVCGVTDGEPLGHYPTFFSSERQIVRPATCQVEGISPLKTVWISSIIGMIPAESASIPVSTAGTTTLATLIMTEIMFFTIGSTV